MCFTVHLKWYRGNKASDKRSLKRAYLRLYHQVFLPRLKEICQVKHFICRVYIDLPDIGAIPADKITSRFLDRSFEVRIHDYQGKNWIFAVPKTQCLILTKSSKVTVKPNKIIVSLAKMAEADNWFSLHKVKCIG